MKLITLTITTFLALLTPTALAQDHSIPESEDLFARLHLWDDTTGTHNYIWLADYRQNGQCTDILSDQATSIQVDLWNCGTQKCTVFLSTDCSGNGDIFFDRPSDYSAEASSVNLGPWRLWGSVLCQWEDSSSCRPEAASITPTPAST